MILYTTLHGFIHYSATLIMFCSKTMLSNALPTQFFLLCQDYGPNTAVHFGILKLVEYIVHTRFIPVHYRTGENSSVYNELDIDKHS